MKLVIATITSLALVAPAVACPNMDHDDNAPRTAEKDKKDAPKADKKDAPKADKKDAAKPTDTAKAKDTSKDKDSKDKDKDTSKKPDKVSER